MKIFPFTFALIGILLSVIYALPSFSISLNPTDALKNIPNPINSASNLANNLGEKAQQAAEPIKSASNLASTFGQIPQQASDSIKSASNLASTFGQIPQKASDSISAASNLANNFAQIPQQAADSISAASNLASTFKEIPLQAADLSLSQMQNILQQAKQVATSTKKSSGLLQNLVPRVDNLINTVRNLAKDLTLGISEVGFKTVLGLPSDNDN